MSDDWNQGGQDNRDENLDNLNDTIGGTDADSANDDNAEQQSDEQTNDGAGEDSSVEGEPNHDDEKSEGDDEPAGEGDHKNNDSSAESTDADSDSEDGDDADLNKAIEEEELDNAISDVTDAAEDDEDYLVTTDWDWVADIIRFLAEVQKSDEQNIAAISTLFYEKDKPLKPLALAEAIEVGVTERAEMTEYILRDMVKKSTMTTDPAQIRASIMELANWAYNVPDEDKRFIHQAATAIAESFPKKIEKTDEDGNTVRADDGSAEMVNAEFAPKRTTKNTSGDEIIALLEELHAKIDTERVTEFTAWYDKIMAHFLIEE